MGVPVPLFNLVYHDAIIMPWDNLKINRGGWGIPRDDAGFLHALANAGIPYLSLRPTRTELQRVKTLCALHRRVGLLEMKEHRFLDSSYRKQEVTFADGTRVCIDLDRDTYDVSPRLKVGPTAKGI